MRDLRERWSHTPENKASGKQDEGLRDVKHAMEHAFVWEMSGMLQIDFSSCYCVYVHVYACVLNLDFYIHNELLLVLKKTMGKRHQHSVLEQNSPQVCFFHNKDSYLVSRSEILKISLFFAFHCHLSPPSMTWLAFYDQSFSSASFEVIFEII